jgi:hypothetical protein
MEVGSPEWIEASLAKLDTLERKRSEHEAALETARDPLSLKEHNAALERLDTEIKSLYAQLEAVAGDDEEEDEDEGDDAEVMPRNTQGDDELSAPHIAREPEPPARDPSPPVVMAASPAAASESPFGGPSGGGFDAAPAPAPVSFDDDVPKGGGAKWMFLGLVVVAGVGVGGFFLWQDMQAKKQQQEAKPATAEEIKIDAAQIREDTEAPNAVKGADATISPTAGGYPTGGSGGNGGGGGGSKKDKDEEKKKKPLTLDQKDDPLG